MDAWRCLLITVVAFTAVGAVDVNITGVGVIRGTSRTLEGKLVDTFTSIPFAKPPTGNLRFMAPRKADPWAGVRNSTTPVHCPQKFIIGNATFGNEDCLYLNIHRPRNAPGTKVAVMVWIHGGSYRMGSGGTYDGEMLAAANNVVVVTVNYRLGLLGFFYVPGTQTKGNYGLMDQIHALNWVQDHIGSFGGDPKKVTIFGESAGSGSVTLLMLSPITKGLFTRVIAQSGAPPNYWAIQKPQNTSFAYGVGRSLGCNSTSNLVSCMRGKSWRELMQVQVKLFEAHPCVTPTVDGAVIGENPLEQMKNGLPASSVELMLGFNKNEGSMFVPVLPKWDEAIFKGALHERLRWQYPKETGLVVGLAAFEYTHYEQQNPWLKYVLSMNNFISEVDFTVGISNFAAAWAKTGAKTYLYHFTYMPAYPRVPAWGVAHAIEIDFVFGKALFSITDPKRYTGGSLLVTNFTPGEANFSRGVMKMWTDFAKTGIPANTWPAYNETKMYLEINRQNTVKSNFGPRRMDFWNKYVPGMIKRANEKVCPTCRPVQCTTPKKDTSGTSRPSHALTSVYILVASVFIKLYTFN